MADVFVSYKSEDRARARVVAETLQAEGFDVWWDPALIAGEDYQEVIDRNLREALVVVVLWSAASVKSRWVRSEATVGDRYGALAPALIEPCDLPTAFVLVQTADLARWTGDRDDPNWREFVADLAAKRDKRRLAAASGAAPPKPAESAIEALFWETIKDSSEAGDFESYLRRYPHGHFIDLAKQRLARRRSADAADPQLFSAGPTSARKNSPLAMIIGALVIAGVGLGAWMIWGRNAPTDIAQVEIEPSTAPSIEDRVETPTAEVHAFFYFTLPTQATEPGRRDWEKVSDTQWIERYPSGHTNLFSISGRITAEGCQGVLIQRQDIAIEGFIPDRGCRFMFYYFRTAGGAWAAAGEMQGIR